MASAGPAPAERIDSGKGVVDTACRCSVAGDRWCADYRRQLLEHGLQDHVAEGAERERYRFGNGGILDNALKVTCLAGLAGQAFLITFSVVENDRLTLLLGRDLLEPLGASLDVKNGFLRIGAGKAELQDSLAGHFAVELRPGDWLRIRDAAEQRETDRTPRRLQPKRRDGPPRPQVNVAERHPAIHKTGWVSCALRLLAPVCAVASLHPADRGTHRVITAHSSEGVVGKAGVRRPLRRTAAGKKTDAPTC